MHRFALVAAAAAVTGTFASSASAINIALDYSLDGGFISSIPNAQATINKAAADISSFITTNLALTQDTNTGTNGSTTLTLDHARFYASPNDPATTLTLPSAVVAANEVRIFVGHQNQTGNTLATGGTGGFYDAGISGSGIPGQGQGAINNAAAASAINLGRGDGPTIGQASGSFTLGAESGTYSYTYGSAIGSLRFDSDTDNINGTDSPAEFAAFYQTDYNQNVGGSQYDLYSVALHEILHSLGIGTSLSWNGNIINGNDWTGAAVSAIIGSGDNNAVVSGHINPAIGSSFVYGTGITQTAVMIPSLNNGERRFLTNLDAAFLQDINWDVVAVPEPTSLAALAMGAMAMLRRRRA